MENLHLSYRFAYTTKGGAHRYSPLKKKTGVDLGEVYLRGVANPPRRLTITVEAKV
jgi:hypothetical protein